MSNEAPEDKLREARDELRQEWAGLQILGRPLTAEEMARSVALERSVKLIEEALDVLSKEDPLEVSEDE